MTDDGDLMQLLTSLAAIRKEYDRMAPAMQAALDTGYGIVMPSVEDLNLEDPGDRPPGRTIQRPHEGQRPLHSHDTGRYCHHGIADRRQ